MSASASSRFSDSWSQQYRPLSKLRKQIRLLVVAPGNGSDLVRGWLQHATLNHECMPSYETISYCWGDSKVQGRILVDGRSMNIPAGSAAAIRSMRKPEKSRTLWIDAVCINQSDPAERSAQVSAMDLVYRMADTNLVYLGSDEDGLAEKTLRSLNDTSQWISAEARHLDIPYEHIRDFRVFFDRVFVLRSQIMLSKSTFESLLPLYELPWFRRLWVLQEVASASRNICFWGNNTFDLEIVTKLALFMTRAGHSTGGLPALSMLEFSRNVMPYTNRANQFDELRNATKLYALANEPRDRVFALLGLFRRQHSLREVPALLKPDYQKPLALVYRDATRHVLNESAMKRFSNEDPLDDVLHRSQADITANNVPSWTLKWDREWTAELDPVDLTGANDSTMRAGIPPHCENAKNYLCSVAEPADMNVLTLRGPTELDLTDEYTEVRQDNVRDILAILDGVVAAVAKGPYDHGNTYRLAAELLTAEDNKVDQRFPIKFGSAEFRKVDGLKALLRHLRETAIFPPFARKITHPEEVPHGSLVCSMFYEISMSMTSHRRFFKLSTGHVGMGPKVLRTGDCVAMIHGKLPLFVLRPIGKEYQLIGPAVVAGLMHGEVFDMGLPSIWIDIR